VSFLASVEVRGRAYLLSFNNWLKPSHI